MPLALVTVVHCKVREEPVPESVTLRRLLLVQEADNVKLVESGSISRFPADVVSFSSLRMTICAKVLP